MSPSVLVVGDIHRNWRPEDGLFLESGDHDLVLFVGDLGDEDVAMVRTVNEVQAPKAVILGNHDPESFRLSDSDPLEPLRDLPDGLRSVLVREESCLSCHRFRDVGGKAGHLRARDGTLVGGFGLPLESYTPEVWRRYVEEPAALMREIGAPHVSLEAEAAPVLTDLIFSERVPSQPE